MEGSLVHQCAFEVVVLEVLTEGHPHVEDILRVPVMPVLRAEHELMVLLLVVCLVDLVAAKESIITVLVVDTHCLFLLVFLTAGLLKRLSCLLTHTAVIGHFATGDL